jgi:hypothetical protein
MDVTLQIFSGRPNPQWRLSANEVAMLTPILERVRSGPQAPHPRFHDPALGYRGFTIDDPMIRGSLHVYRGDVCFASGKVAHSGPEIETFLLNSAPIEQVEPSVKNYISTAITLG